MIQMPATYEYLFQLISAAFNAQTPPEKPENVSWDELYHEAKRQNVFMITYESVKHLQSRPDEQQSKRWKHRCNKLLTKSINQSVEIEKLLDYFESNGVDVLPLKGYILRDFYPRRDLREMTDFDLLVRDDRSEKMKKIMAELGYEALNEVNHHAEYKKAPYVIIELHSKLLPDRFGHKSYCSGVWKRSKCCESFAHVYEMSIEDYLIFNLLHFEKHYHNTGCGIRFIVDLHAILRRYEASFNVDYFNAAIDKLNLREFTDTAFALERAVFSEGLETETAQKMLNKMIDLGAFGSSAGREMNIIDRLTPKNGNKKIGKLRYYLQIVFPPVSEMKCSYPVVEKAKFLLPVFWVCRGVKTIFRNPKHIREHYQRIMSYGEDESKSR